MFTADMNNLLVVHHITKFFFHRAAETAAMVLIEGEFPLTWFFTTALLSKRETKVSSVYTWTDDTAEGV